MAQVGSRHGRLGTIARLEDTYDRVIPRGPFPSRLSADQLAIRARWSSAVWDAAETAGPLPLHDEQLRHGLSLAQRPVFVCGAHRSGSTLVRDLLDGHPALSVLPSEGSYLTDLSSKLAALPAAERLRFFGQE